MKLKRLCLYASAIIVIACATCTYLWKNNNDTEEERIKLAQSLRADYSYFKDSGMGSHLTWEAMYPIKDTWAQHQNVLFSFEVTEDWEDHIRTFSPTENEEDGIIATVVTYLLPIKIDKIIDKRDELEIETGEAWLSFSAVAFDSRDLLNKGDKFIAFAADSYTQRFYTDRTIYGVDGQFIFYMTEDNTLMSMAPELDEYSGLSYETFITSMNKVTKASGWHDEKKDVSK